MWFERMSCGARWGVESERDRIGVLQGCVEGITEVHEECIAAPPESVLDIGVREPYAIQ